MSGNCENELARCLSIEDALFVTRQSSSKEVSRPQARPLKFLHPGSVVDGRYRIESFLGTGGMCEVYKAFHLQLMKPVALKMLLAKFMIDQEAVERFHREAVAMATLNHPNIVEVYGCGRFDSPFQSRLYTAIEFVEGCSLSDFAQRRNGKRLSRELALPIFLQICDALEHAHDHGIVHRDLKPTNVMIGHDGQTVKVVDFGIAKILAERGGMNQALTQTGEIIGSVGYMSPEQCAGMTVDRRADVYSMGCLMYETLTGEPPMKADSVYATIHKHLFEMPEIKPEVADDFGSVIMSALAKEPDDRPQSALELKCALSDPSCKKQKPAGVSSPSWSRFASAKLLIAVVLVLAGLVMLSLRAPSLSEDSRDSDQVKPIDQFEWSAGRLSDLAQESENRNPAKAMMFYRQILRLKDRATLNARLEAIAGLSRLCRASGQYQLAGDYAKRLQREAPRNGPNSLNWRLTANDLLLWSYFMQKNYHQVLAVSRQQENLVAGRSLKLSQAVCLSRALEVRARALVELKDLSGACLASRQSCQILDGYSLPSFELYQWLSRYNTFIICLIEQRNFGEAERACRRAEHFMPGLTEHDLKLCAGVYCKRSAAWARAGRTRSAVDDLTRAIALDVRSADAYRERGRLYEALGRRVLADRDRKIADSI